jgi:membrane associated rhomboid family serine protease
MAAVARSRWQLLWLFAFDAAAVRRVGARAGPIRVAAAEIWTFVTYALLHGSWTHLILNSVWLLAFGTPVARRFGAALPRFLSPSRRRGARSRTSATFTQMRVPMIGASASISGFMAAAIRFAFQRGGPLRLIGDNRTSLSVPALPLLAVLRNPRVLIFLGVWFGLNLLFGLGSFGIDGDDQAIAWQAHIGGFLAGTAGLPAV